MKNPKTQTDSAPSSLLTQPISDAEIAEIKHIEAFFFAYRDFIRDADKELEKLGFGRAHHRVLFFVNRKPGLMVAELLETLSITKQSLSRVLKQLIECGYISQRAGEKDRRQRLLYPTVKGRELILLLSHPQSERIANAISACGTENSELINKFMLGMTNNEQKR